MNESVNIGRTGLNALRVLESAPDRPVHIYPYDEAPSLFKLDAACGFGPAEIKFYNCCRPIRVVCGISDPHITQISTEIKERIHVK
jgi:hypothetical protein